MRRTLCLLLGMVPLLFFTVPGKAQQEPFTLTKAVVYGLSHYQTIQAKKEYLKASASLVQQTRSEYLPNIVAGLQEAYGTANGQFGSLGPGSIQGLSASGPFNAGQSWNAAFASQYILSTNWEVFSFGRLQSKISSEQARVTTDSMDVVQEQFIQGVKIADAFLSLLIAQRLVTNAKANIERAKSVQTVVTAKAKSGLIAGVDSSISNAQVSSAKIALNDAVFVEQDRRNMLARMINAEAASLQTDSSFFFRNIPANFSGTNDFDKNPQVQFYQSRIAQNEQYTTFLKKSILPGVNLFNIWQTRGSGFYSDYSPVTNPHYTKSVFQGISPTRINYVAGVSIAWNIVSIAKNKHLVQSQEAVTRAMQQEADLVSSQLKNQLALADERIANALERLKEVPVQYKAASDAYLQKSVLYRNGLTDMVDIQQALFALNKAETDVGIGYINVWQALLLKAAASGDFNLFLEQAGK